MDKNSRILVTGGTGLMGGAVCRLLEEQGYTTVKGIGSRDCDLTDWPQTRDFVQGYQPDYIFHIAARVYGIAGNMANKGVSFYDNVRMNTNMVEAARLAKVKKITAMGSVCVYPYPTPAPDMKEDMVWQGYPHPAEDSYAQSKRTMLAHLIAYNEQYGLDYAFIISGNLYGPGDSFDTDHGHVIPSLVRKFYEAATTGGQVSVWGNGSAQRDFTYVDDAARATVHIMQHVSGAVNLGSGQVNSIREVADLLAAHTGLAEHVVWDASKPNGQIYRNYDVTRLKESGFKPQITLAEGLARTYDWYAKHAATARKGAPVPVNKR